MLRLVFCLLSTGGDRLFLEPALQVEGYGTYFLQAVDVLEWRWFPVVAGPEPNCCFADPESESSAAASVPPRLYLLSIDRRIYSHVFY
jgi:hypothetical protein